MSTSTPGVADDPLDGANPIGGRFVLMQIDSYETPGTETLLQLGRQRHFSHGRDHRLLVTEAVAAAAFLLAAVALAVFGSSPRSFSIVPLAVTVPAYLAAGRVRFQVGSAWTPPTQ